MMSARDEAPKPYELDPAFEAAVVTLACSSPKFFGRIGYALDYACMNTVAARLAVQAAHAVHADTGQGPERTLVVLQRLLTWKTEGKVAREQIVSVTDLFDNAEDSGLPSEDAAVAELKPVLSTRLRRKAVTLALDAHKNNSDLSAVVALEEQAQRLGNTDTSIGTVVGEASFAEIEYLRTLERLPTGIMELDTGLNGGLQRAGIGVVMADSGGGKSMFLSHIAGVACGNGHLVACVSLELPKAIWHARTIANLTGIPIEALLTDTKIKTRAVAALKARTGMGAIVIQQMPAMGTTCADIIAWVDNVEQHWGQPITVLIVDFVDKMCAPMKGSKEMGSYETGKIVMEGMRGYAEHRNIWCWTASHSTGRTKKNKRLDMGDVAESMNKPRIADLWLTQMVSDDQDEIEWFVAKHRTAKSRFTIGPLPTEFEVGRVAPIVVGA